MTEYLDRALELLDEGWWVVPIKPDEKRPAVLWSDIYEEGRFPTEDEVISWWQAFPDSYVGIITGKLSGVLVVDCDNQEALDYAESKGLTNTPWVVRTKRGKHFYFKWPDTDEHIKTLTWVNADGVEWPKETVKGLDRKAHKGVVLVPPTPNYTQIIQGDWDDVPVYQIKDYGSKKTEAVERKSNVVSFEDFKFENLSLAHIELKRTVIEDTDEYVRNLGRKMMPKCGDNIHSRLVSLAGYYVSKGMYAEEAYDLMQEFMDKYVSIEPKDQKAWDQEVRSCIAHAMKHEKVSEKKPEPKPEPQSFKPITTEDVDRLEQEMGEVEYFVEPIIPTSGTIMQVHGYSGHGKSLFTRHMLYAAACGADKFGPFDVHKPPKVLYLDFENSKSNITQFLSRCKRSFGDAKDRFMIWAPFIDDRNMNLKTKEGVANLENWIKFNNPDIVVVDTVRTAWTGLLENSADDWANINEMAQSLRNSGITCILVHHTNKPSEGGRLGREAGSTAQLNTIETQIKVTQVYSEKETADARAGLYDGDLAGLPRETLRNKLRTDERLQVCLELRYGKVREETDVHCPYYYIGFAEDENTENIKVVSEHTPKQLAMLLCKPWVDRDGVTRPPLSDAEIYTRIKSTGNEKPVSVIRKWTAEYREAHIASEIANQA